MALSKGAFGTKGAVDIVFMDDRRIAGLALRFRGSAHATDVLAFCYDDGGDIAVSLDTAARQAKERGVPFSDEILLLCVHGLLHLRGQGDETYRDWCGMRVKEFETMMKIGLSLRATERGACRQAGGNPLGSKGLLRCARNDTH